MITKLPSKINTVAEAKIFLSALHANKEAYHPEDDAHQIEWNICTAPTHAECDLLNYLFIDIYNLEDNNGKHINPVFDPCQYLLELDPEYVERMYTNGNYSLDIYLHGDQPTTCPKCGRRPDITDYINDKTHYQINICPCHEAPYIFKTMDN